MILKPYKDVYPIRGFFSGANPLGLTQSKAKDYSRCKAFFYWRHIARLESGQKSQALIIGDITHQLLAEYFKSNQTINADSIKSLPEITAKIYPNLDDSMAEIVYTAAKLLVGYAEKYADDKLNVIEVEKTLDITNLAPLTGFAYHLTGTIDAIAQDEKGTWQFEHKTTARYDEYYLNGLKGGLQGRLYHILMEMHGFKPLGVIYNLLVKTKTPQFERQVIMISTNHAMNVLKTFNGMANEIIKLREKYGDLIIANSPPLELWPDFGQCFTYNRECEYSPLCHNIDNPDKLKMAKSFFAMASENNEKPLSETN